MNHYAPPSAPVADPPEKRENATTVLIGAAIGNGINYMVLYIVGLVFVWTWTFQGVQMQDLYSRVYGSVPYLLVAHATGFLCLMVGGYWTANLSQEKPIRSAVLAGCVTLLFAFIGSISPIDYPIPLWSNILSYAVPIPAYWLGAVWWRRSVKSESM